MLFVETLQKLTKCHSIVEYSRFVVCLAESRNIGKYMDDNLCIQGEPIFGLEELTDGFPQVSSSIMTSRNTSLNITIGKLL